MPALTASLMFAAAQCSATSLKVVVGSGSVGVVGFSGNGEGEGCFHCQRRFQTGAKLFQIIP
ncbi:hypothetical protein J2T14_005086 [Paenibacillus harenae]|nr:hypothetical protein [Paenibacillus harenae]